MSLSRNKLIDQAQIVASRNYLMSFPGLFQQAGPLSGTNEPGYRETALTKVQGGYEWLSCLKSQAKIKISKKCLGDE